MIKNEVKRAIALSYLFWLILSIFILVMTIFIIIKYKGSIFGAADYIKDWIFGG